MKSLPVKARPGFAQQFRIMIYAAGLFFCALRCSWAQPQELLGDANFESSTPNGTFPSSGFWQPAWLGQAGAVCTTTAGRSGNGLWEYTGSQASDWWSGQFQQYAATPGLIYRGSAWIRTPPGEPWVTGSKAVVQVWLIRSSGNDVYESTGVTNANTTWVQYQVQSPPAPYDALQVRFVCYLQKPVVTGQSIANYDDCSLSAVLPILTITGQPQTQIVPIGGTATFSVAANGAGPLLYQWQFNESDLLGSTGETLTLTNVLLAQAGAYRVVVSDTLSAQVSQEAILTVVVPRTCRESASLSVEHLRRVMDEFHNRIPVYDDISSPGNRFHARGQLPDQFSQVAINGSWTNNPHSGATCIRCSFTRVGDNFGGFYFMNGILLGPNAPPPLLPNAPAPYFGGATIPGTSIAVTDFTGLNLDGASALTFWARGEYGDELIEFFMGGVGRDPIEPYPDSTPRYPPVGTAFVLTKEWQKFTLDLSGLNLTNIMGGFGWVANAPNNPNGAIFYLDDIQYELSPIRLEQRLNEPRFLRSFLTKPVQPSVTDSNRDDDLDFVLRNTAFLYDNAVALEAFLADGEPDSLRRARLIGDAMVYASWNDRTYVDGRLRTAYAAGDIALPPGWEPNGKKGTVPVPGFYLEEGQSFFEVENRDIDTGNNAWAMLSLLALYERVGGDQYLAAARRVGRFIETFRDNEGLYQGFRGGIWSAETVSPTNRAFASTEHNLDVIGAFTRMFRITGEAEWADGAEHARGFVETMWDSSIGCYRPGTNETDPETRNESPLQLPLDTQSWNVLARPEALTLHPQLLNCAEQNHRNIHDGLSGYDFNGDKDGVWLEGTAQMAVAYVTSQQLANADNLLATLRAAQQMPPPIGDGLGIVAASHDAVSSGFFDSFGFPIKLFRRPHVGATAWNVFAQLGFNPYYQSVSGPRITLSISTNGAVISWPTCFSDFVLEEKNDLAAANWTPVGTQNPVVIPINSTNHFYRLRQQM